MKQLEQTKQLLFKQTSPEFLPVSVDHPHSSKNSTPAAVREPLRSISPLDSNNGPPTPTPRSSRQEGGAEMSVTSTNSAASSAAAPPDFALGHPKEFNVAGLKLPALAAVQVDEREVTLRRNAEGDFGFTIRRAALADGTTVVFAEPAESKAGPPRPSDLLDGLLPGDVLLAVEGREVQRMSREELLEWIHAAGASIRLRVRVVPELAELCGRVADGDGRIQLNGEQKGGGVGTSTVFDDIPPNERYWLIHSTGYTAARLVANEPDGRCRIRVADAELFVDSADIDRANPPEDDRRNDLAALKYVNETAALHLLRQRCGSNLRFTAAGTLSLVHVGAPFGDEQAGPLNEELVRLFRSCRRSQMPAHIYATAQQVYRNLQTTAKNQSMVVTGVTGSGKSLQMRGFVRFLCGCAGWSTLLNFRDIECAIGILEAFGNCATAFNQNASRFVQFLTLGFNSSAALCSAKFQLLLLDTERLIKRPLNESAFHVFHYFWEAEDSALRERLHLDLIDRPFFGSLDSTEERSVARCGWFQLLEALRQLGFSATQIDGIANILAAITHLLHSGATNNVASRASFVRVQNAQAAAELLGLSLEQLAVGVFRGNQQHEMSSRFTLTNRTGAEALESFVQALYNELFAAIGQQINQQLGKFPSTTSISLLDLPGSTYFAGGPQQKKSSGFVGGLSDLLFNYVNERVAELFYRCSFVEPAEVYAREQVNVNVEKPLASPEAITRLLDLKQQLLNSADVERRSEEARGLLYILEEESVFPGAQEASFFERIFIHAENSRSIRRGARGTLQFVLGHANGAAPCVYSVDGWLKRAQPSHAASTVPQLLQNSKLDSILHLFSTSRIESSFKLRRATQSVNELLASGRSFGGFFSNIAVQLDHVFNTIERTNRVKFVHCLQAHRPNGAQSDVLEVGYVRNQMRSYLLIDSIRASNHGYPERMPFRDFRRRYECLLPVRAQTSLSDALDDRSAVQRILEAAGIYEHRSKLGLSQVLLRTDVLMELDERRDLCLSGLIVALQQQCRRHLTAKWLEKRRIQEQAIWCIQRNAQVYFRLRAWPWWKLYQNVLPLLEHASNDQAEREMREKIQRAEQAAEDLRAEKNRIASQLEEMEQLLNTECQTSQSLGVSLERESEARVQLEAEIRSLKARMQRREQEADEVSERQSNADTIVANGSAHECEWNKKPAVDAAVQRDLERLKAAEVASRLKIQKLQENLNDEREQLENHRSRNEALEKRSQNFNNEVQEYKDKMAEMEAKMQKMQAEMTDSSLKFNKKSAELQELRDQNAEMRSTLSRTRRELDDLTNDAARGEGGSEAELSALRKSKRELEQKVVDLENQLDELQTDNELLNQNLTRQSLSVEQLRADARRATERKEEELEEIRSTNQRRIRTYEEQINDLNESVASLQRQLRLFEQRNRQFDVQSQYSFESNVQDYRREYRKTLALLKDAQNLLAMERQKSDKSSMVRRLQRQLEAAEEAKMSALRSKASLESEIGELNVEIENLRNAKAGLEKRVTTLLQEKADAVSNARDIEEQLNSTLRDYNNHLLQTEANNLTITRQAEVITELEAEKQKLSLQLAEAESKNSHFHSHYVEAHKIMLLETRVKELQSRVEYERCEKQKYEANVNRLQDEVDRLEERITDLQRTAGRHEDEAKRQKLLTLAEQEKTQEMRKRFEEAEHKFKKIRDQLEETTETCEGLRSDLVLSNRRIEALQAALNSGLDAEDDQSDLDDDLDESRSVVTGGTGSVVNRTSPSLQDASSEMNEP